MLKKFPVKNKRPILPDILTCNRKTGLGNTMGIENWHIHYWYALLVYTGIYLQPNHTFFDFLDVLGHGRDYLYFISFLFFLETGYSNLKSLSLTFICSPHRKLNQMGHQVNRWTNITKFLREINITFYFSAVCVFFHNSNHFILGSFFQKLDGGKNNFIIVLHFGENKKIIWFRFSFVLLCQKILVDF